MVMTYVSEKIQPTRIHGHLLSDLVPSLPHCADLATYLYFESLDDLRHLDHAAVVPNSTPDPSGLVQSHQQQHSHKDSVGRSLQHVCASTEHRQ
jgi:hypothetical protein